ncbi:MAG: hypothetical protein AABX52_01090 [Nanoarchaeota archaeon]
MCMDNMIGMGGFAVIGTVFLAALTVLSILTIIWLIQHIKFKL